MFSFFSDGFVIPSVFINLLTAPEKIDIPQAGPMKMPLINIYLNCCCHPSLVVISFSEQLSLSISSLARSHSAGPSVAPTESKELREAQVNNCKPIKITLHLSRDLY